MADDGKREKRKPNLVDKIWDFFTSLKLLIVLLLILSLLSVVGTIIEQNKPLQEYYNLFRPETVELFSNLGLLDMYHSWWFTSCLALLALNIIACTMDRYPSIMKGLRTQDVLLDERLETGLSNLTTIKYNLPVEAVETQVRAAVGKDFHGNPRVTEEEHARHFFYEKGGYSRFSFFLTHLSVIVIFVGAIIGSLFGFKGYVNVNEGETISAVTTRKGEMRALDFGVRCNSFAVDYYAGGAPKDYRSDLSIVRDGKEMARKTIRVNDPLSYEGITFYQSSFGGAPDVTFEIRDQKGTVLGDVLVPFGGQAAIPGSAARIEVVDYQEHFHLPDGSEGGPAIGVNIYRPDGGAEGIWVREGRPSRSSSGDFTFLVKGLKMKKYTGLQVNRDPGVWLVWTGCVMLVAGIMMAFFMAHKRLWIRIRKDKKGRTEVTLGGAANKNKHTFSGEFEKLAARLREVS